MLDSAPSVGTALLLQSRFNKQPEICSSDGDITSFVIQALVFFGNATSTDFQSLGWEDTSMQQTLITSRTANSLRNNP